jgi:hypothetical protein
MGTYFGTVTAAGEVMAVHHSIPDRTVAGTIHGNAFTGQRLVVWGRACQYVIEMSKQ